MVYLHSATLLHNYDIEFFCLLNKFMKFECKRGEPKDYLLDVRNVGKPRPDASEVTWDWLCLLLVASCESAWMR